MLSFSNFKESELIQYLKFVGLGPSLKTCPRCAPQLAQVTSVLIIPCDVSLINERLSSEITS